MMVVSRDMTPNSIRSVTYQPGVIASAFLCACMLLFPMTNAATAQSSGPPALPRVEQRIRDYVRAHEAEQVDFLERAVNISSGTFNLAGVRAVGKLF
ncbi:MAG TPA: hypothetical protein VE052_01250, partial [Gemmatimonadaceae bacterium]|nr:hypothetical protein [Gemmatimonadaceae bacterium]